MSCHIVITTCSTCPFGVRPGEHSRDADYCSLLGRDYGPYAGGFTIPPAACPWRHGGVDFVFDEAEAKRLYGEWERRQREYHAESLKKMMDEARTDGDAKLVQKIEQMISEYVAKWESP